MYPQAIDEANRKLLEPPDFDPTDSARLGLFVVAQLANRHGIRVSLRPSAFGGVTAIVLIPGELVSAGPGPMELGAGPSPADKSWDRPLVGTGTDEPSRHSLAALQWQGTEELRSVTVPGRPVTINGTTATGPVTGETIHRPPVTPSGPAPSSVVEGLSAEGLVQRRRTMPRRTRPPGDRPRAEHLAETAAALSPAPPAPVVPTSPAPSTEDGLPRRVRQASLAPQLRAPVEEEVDTAPSRSPEQVRSLMSALQRGTTRGRLAAAGVDPDAPVPSQRRPGDDESFADAATVIFPVVQNRVEPEGSDAPAGHGRTEPREIIETAEINIQQDRAADEGRAADRHQAGDRNQAARPDKDA
jgi:hypothetical protein